MQLTNEQVWTRVTLKNNDFWVVCASLAWEIWDILWLEAHSIECDEHWWWIHFVDENTCVDDNSRDRWKLLVTVSRRWMLNFDAELEENAMNFHPFWTCHAVDMIEKVKERKHDIIAHLEATYQVQ